MADISHIKGPDNTSYDIKDAVARSDASNKVSKSGDTMTGNLKMEGANIPSIIFKESGYGDKFEIKPYFSGTDESNYLAIKTATGGSGTDPSTTEKIKIYPSGTIEVSGSRGGSWVSSKDPHQASISITEEATNGTRYDSIIAEKCYNKGVISIGRITNELHIGYVAGDRTANSLAKSMCFNPVSDKISFQSDGSEKCKITISTGSFDGKWNGVTDDHNTNNTTDTWVPVYSNNNLQHRVIPVAYNTAPLNITSAHALPSYSGTAVPSTQYLAYWNGAYGGGTSSNLKYTAVGQLSHAATKSWLTSMDGASGASDGTRILASNPAGTGIMGSFLRASFADWSTTFTVACKGSAGAMGHVTICTGGNDPSWCEYSIQKGGSNANWTWLYNSTYKDTGKNISSGITVSASTATYNNITYNIIKFTATSQKKWFACWGVSDNTSA